MKFPKLPSFSHFRSSAHILHHYLFQEFLVAKYAVLQEKSRIKSIYTWLTTRTLKQHILAGAVTASVMLIGFASLVVLFINPRSHTYSYSDSSSNCFFNPVFIPNSFKSTGSDTYQSTAMPKVSIGNTPIMSTTTCLALTKIPEQTENTLQIKSPLAIQKSITLPPANLPNLTPFESLMEPVSRDAVLLFQIDQPDKTFDYNLQINDKLTDCVLHDTLLGCPLESQNLAQGQKYGYTVNRAFRDEISKAISGEIATLDPVAVTSSTIGQNENVYTKPNVVTLTTSKNLKSVGETTIISVDDQTDFPVTIDYTDTTITLSFDAELPRNTNYVLTIDNIISTDGASLTEPYVLNFKTSSGPKLQSASIGSYKVSLSSSITLTFDVELDPTQPISNSAKLTDSNGEIASNISIQNNSIIINPINNLSSCTNYTITVSDSLLSKYGVSGGSAWSMQTRTICQQVFSIGTSVRGSGLTAYKFGNGGTKIIYIGGLHGNEKSSVLTLNSWIDDLERNYQDIPADKSVIVIPNASPDSYDSSSRLNANGVDLNRNFPSNNWQSGVHIPGGIYLENGGGTNALSEPEANALANYLIGASPRLILTYHATAGAVIYNEAVDSSAYSSVYSKLSGYSNLSSSQEDGLFNYPTTGELEDWLRDKRNVPTLLVELATQYSNNFTRNKSAMWAMLYQ